MYLLDKASKITIILEMSNKLSVLPRKAMLPFLKLETHIGAFINLFGGGEKLISRDRMENETYFFKLRGLELYFE